MDEQNDTTTSEVKNEISTPEVVPVSPTPAPSPKPPVKPAEKKVEQPKVSVHKPIELQYKLNIYSYSGNIKQSISAPIYQDMSRRYGDIMRSISSTKWCTMDEILKSVWQLEKKMKYPSNRTRKSVELAVNELVSLEFVITR